jgi:hypothetical protein
MQTLTNDDIIKVLRSMPKKVRDFLAWPPYRIWIAGGYIRSIIANEEPTDLDLFVSQEARMLESEIAHSLGSSILRKGIVTNTDNAFTVTSQDFLPIQFITRWKYSRIEDLLNSFDFTIAQAAIWHERGVWLSMCADEFYSSLASKSLVYRAPDRDEDAGGSILRVLRFLRKGYSISPEHFSAVLARLIVGGKIGDGIDCALDDVDKQKAMANQITRQLRLVDPLHLVAGVPETAVARFEEMTQGDGDGLREVLED